MKKYQSWLLPALAVLAMTAWLGRSQIRNLFPPAMKFANTVLTPVASQGNIKVSDFRGQVLLVSCFQTWCVDCARETPVIASLKSSIPDTAFKVLYISDESPEKINAFSSRFGNGQVIFAHSAASMQEIGISVFPSTFLLNKKGEVVMTKLEGYDWMQEAATIKQLLAE